MDITQFYWITKDNAKIRMIDMEVRHLQAAHTHACEKEFEYFHKQNIFNSLREMLEKVAAAREIALKYPDERFPSKKWGKYFCAIRQTNAIVPEPIVLSNMDLVKAEKDATLASNSSKEVNPLQL